MIRTEFNYELDWMKSAIAVMAAVLLGYFVFTCSAHRRRNTTRGVIAEKFPDKH